MLTRVAVKAFPFVFYGLILIFLILLLLNLDFSQLTNIDFNWWYFAFAIAVGIGYRYWGALTWVNILQRLGASALKLNANLVYVYAKSWLGRYIPGTAPWILGKIYFASKFGISKNKLATSSLLEGILQIIVTLLLALLILFIDSRSSIFINSGAKFAMIGAAILGAMTLLPPVFNRIIAIVYRLIKKKPFPEEHKATPSAVVSGVGLYIIGAFIGGLSFLLVTKAVYEPLGWNEVLYVLGVSNLANAVSMLAVFAPSGIGVREGIQIALLSAVMPLEIAAIVAIITRLWGIGVDFLFFGLARLGVRNKSP